MALSNLLISNNVVRNVTNGINIIGAGTYTNVDVVNNSFYGGLNGISIPGTLNSSNILNNAFNGNTSLGTGILVGTLASTTIDYNVVFGYAVEYGGSATRGSNGIITDPLYRSSTDLRVLQGSACIDKGTDVSSYGITEDIRAESRPQIMIGYPPSDNGTDIGAYEMLQSELTPNTYYVNAGGTNTPPYANVASGANSFTDLLSNVSLGGQDIIEVVDNGVI